MTCEPDSVPGAGADRRPDAQSGVRSGARPYARRGVVCRCDVDPEVYRVFAFAVLALHTERRTTAGPWCSCGKRRTACAYARLAEEILFAPVAEPPAVPDAPATPGRPR